jgi:multidrug efflux pump subunit AcrA (membrane-fusion protein)
MNDKTNEAQRSRASSTKRKQTFTIGAIAAAVVVAVGVWYFLAPGKEAPGAAADAHSAKKERKILYWTDPMVPGFKSDKPGKSPFMDMELVPVYDDEQGRSSVAGGRTPGATDEAGAAVVSVRPEIVQNLGVRTHTVTRGGAPRTLTTQGYLFRDGGILYALVDIFDREATWVRVGLAADVRVSDLPGRTWRGVVAHVKSDVDIGTRTYQARVRVQDPDPALQPNMFADVTVKTPARDGRLLLVPREALIRTGTRTALVLALGEGRFQPVEVVPGVEYDDWVEIKQGIKDGDTVVVSGQFLIDSEASVRASLRRMEPAADAPSPPAATTPAAPPAADPHAGHKR